jgi:hypothetical protein
LPNDEIISEFDRHASDQDWFDEGNELYKELLDQLIGDFPDRMDDTAADFLYNGWFNPDTDRFERAEVWFDFFDYTGLSWDDFDWKAWQEWYES